MARVGQDRIWSVDLPPGIGRNRCDVEMALTERNRGTITKFVYDQLDVVPNAHLVVHPLKAFAYADHLELIASVLELTGRELAVENTSVETDWYTPDAIAFFGYAGQVRSSRRALTHGRYVTPSLTIDTPHLPAPDTEMYVDKPDPEVMAALRKKLDEDTLELRKIRGESLVLHSSCLFRF